MGYNDYMYYNYKTYPAPDSRAVIFFAAPFGVKLKQLRWTIRSLQKAGYTVVAYDADPQILTSGDLKLLRSTADKVARDIRDQIKAYRSGGCNDFGFFGSSLGALMMYYCVATIRELRWGVLSASGDGAEALWRHPKLRALYQELEIGPDELEHAWQKLLKPKFLNMSHKRILFVSSTKDKILPRSDLEPLVVPLRQNGAKVDIIELNIWGHNLTVLFGLLHAKKLVARVHEI